MGDERRQLAQNVYLKREHWLRSGENLFEAREKEREVAEAAETVYAAEQLKFELGGIYRSYVISRTESKVARYEKATAAAEHGVQLTKALYSGACQRYKSFVETSFVRRIAPSRSIGAVGELHIKAFLYKD